MTKQVQADRKNIHSTWLCVAFIIYPLEFSVASVQTGNQVTRGKKSNVEMKKTGGKWKRRGDTGDDNASATTAKKEKSIEKSGSKKAHKSILEQCEIKKFEQAGGNTSKGKNQSKATELKVVVKKSKVQERRKQALLEANVQEDKEIKKLERYLGLNKRKNKKTLPQSFAEDGLDYILGALEPGLSTSGMYANEEDMEVSDANDGSENIEVSNSELSSEAGDQVDCDDFEDHPDSDNDSGEMAAVVGEDEDLGTVEDGESSESVVEGNDTDEPGEDIAEVAEEIDCTSQKLSGTSEKYVPPQLRDAVDSQRRAQLEKLKRTVKGLVNRLSEPNLASISSQLEELYMNHSRKDMNDTLTEVLLAACVTSALMPDRLLMEHVLLVSVLHHTVGLEVGAHFLETVVRRFEEVYQSVGEGKEGDNLVAIVAHLYNFQVVHSMLIFDILKKLAGSFTEKDIELILFVLKKVGFALRKDDALALKELISEAQRKASSLGDQFQDNTRVRFMLETMMALKNNDMRKIPGYDPEPVERLRKLLRSLVNQCSGGSDVKLRVSLQNLLAADQVGRWWIVGSSWSGAPMIGDHGNKQQQSSGGGQFSAKVLDLARKQRMNTDVRRNIFCVLMTSEDYMDAFEKLLRLGLKDRQEREIVHVILVCCLQEKSFNGFYAVLGQKFCSHDRRFQMTFQFSLWDKFKDLSTLSSNSFSNLVQLVVLLIQKKSLSLSILKVIEFGELDKPKVRFLRLVLTKLLNGTEPGELESIFGRISGIPKLGMLREGLKLFISHFLLKNIQSLRTAEQARLLTERAEIATKAMEAKDAKLKL
ncbi:hypothetical protein GJAV_G00077350 [Gymnothorax javanicus]|nr:hypothetical protein GJAV_G00077350 [Gymnothorax javanicus]